LAPSSEKFTTEPPVKYIITDIVEIAQYKSVFSYIFVEKWNKKSPGTPVFTQGRGTLSDSSE